LFLKKQLTIFYTENKKNAIKIVWVHLDCLKKSENIVTNEITLKNLFKTQEVCMSLLKRDIC